MERTLIPAGSKWEPIIGYSRAVKIGNSVHVSGTAPSGPDGKVVAPGDPYAQTKRCLEIIEEALAKAGAKMSDVYRTRMYLTDISQWESVGRAHGEYFGEVRPATTIVEVSKLISPEMLVEIEADAHIG
ncbi:MAG: RidA family protein [Candidatus Hydrogenedentes bacterium]|nr:RidA family protein [Candidatus Hydrogenedentota bacterium]